MMQEPQVEEDRQAAQERTEEKLQTFGSNLAQQRDEWIRSRYSYGVDKAEVQRGRSPACRHPAAHRRPQLGYPAHT